MARRKSIWLSVDWDFFQQEKSLWDWSHREDPIYQNIVWLTRMHFGGKSLVPETSPELFEPKASKFWLGLNAPVVRGAFGVADSHAVALPFFHKLGQKHGPPDEIWNIDAHHDLGYDPLDTLRGYAKQGRAEAGSWLYVLMRQYPTLKAQFVHPTWKDPSVEARPWVKEHSVANRVTVTSASAFEWLQTVTIEGVFIAKSEAWSPPWNDDAFAGFVSDAESYLGLTPDYYQRDVTMPREFDEEAAEQFHQKTMEAMERNRG